MQRQKEAAVNQPQRKRQSNPTTVTVPVEAQVWTAAECAAYLRQGVDRFLRVTRFEPWFPQPLEMSRKGQPRWSAAAVIKGALS